MKKITLIFVLFLLSSFIGVYAQLKSESTLIHFNNNSNVIENQTKSTLDSLLKVFGQLHVKNIEIYGHTDYIGSDRYNKKLSDKRVNSVYKYFISKGVEPSYVETRKGYGERRPKFDNTTEVGRSLNRRVEIVYTFEAWRYSQIQFESKKENNIQSDQKFLETLYKNNPIYEAKSYDTVIVSSRGTVLFLNRNSFGNIPLSKMTFEFKEYFDQPSLRTTSVQTIMNDGRCLISGGILFIKAMYDGMEIPLVNPIEIAIPTFEIVNDLELFKSDTTSYNFLTWVRTKNPVKIDTVDFIAHRIKKEQNKSKRYYWFDASMLGWLGCHYIKGDQDILNNTNPENYIEFSLPNYTSNNITVETFQGMNYIQAKRVNQTTFRFPKGCLDVEYVTAYFYINGEKMVCRKKLTDIKNKGNGQYILKEKWFKKD